MPPKFAKTGAGSKPTKPKKVKKQPTEAQQLQAKARQGKKKQDKTFIRLEPDRNQSEIEHKEFHKIRKELLDWCHTFPNQDFPAVIFVTIRYNKTFNIDDLDSFSEYPEMIRIRLLRYQELALLLPQTYMDVDKIFTEVDLREEKDEEKKIKAAEKRAKKFGFSDEEEIEAPITATENIGARDILRKYASAYERSNNLTIGRINKKKSKLEQKIEEMGESDQTGINKMKEEIEDIHNKAVTGNLVSVSIHFTNTQYRKSIRDQIMIEKNLTYEEVTDEMIDHFFNKQINLPMYYFLLKLSVSDISRAKDLLHKFPDIPTQFKVTFLRLSDYQKQDFASLIITTFPPDQYLLSYVSAPLLSMLIKYVNENKVFVDPISIPDKIATGTPGQILTILRSLPDFNQTQYVPNVNEVLDKFSDDEITELLQIYQPMVEGDHIVGVREGILVSIVDENEYYQFAPVLLVTIEFNAAIIKYLRANAKALAGANLERIFNVIDKQFNCRVYETENEIYRRWLSEVSKGEPHTINSDDPLLTEPELEDIIEADFDIGTTIADELLAELKIDREERYALSVLDIKKKLTRYGIPFTFGEAPAMKILKQRRKDNIITKEIYKQQRAAVRQFYAEYRLQSKRGGITKDADFSKKRSFFAKNYDKMVSDMVKEARDAGNEPNLVTIQDDVFKNLIEEARLSQEQGRTDFLSPQDIEVIRARLGKSGTSKIVEMANRRHNADELKEIIKTMPDAVKLGLQSILDSTERALNNVSTEKRAQLSRYYQFIHDVMVANWGITFPNKNIENNGRTMKDVLEYYRQLGTIEPEFLTQVVEKIRIGATGMELIALAAQQTSQRTKILKNPLKNQRTRRHERMRLLMMRTRNTNPLGFFVSDKLTGFQQEIMIAHKLKPWIKLEGNVTDWNLLIAYPDGSVYEKIPKKWQSLFSSQGLPQSFNNLHFYRPSNIYWQRHQQTAHRVADKIHCDLEALKESQQYAIELYYNSNLNRYYQVTENDHNAECEYFKNKYDNKSVDAQIDEMRKIPIATADTTMKKFIGSTVKQILLDKMASIKIKYGTIEVDLSFNATAMEKALFDSTPGTTMNDYLNNIFMFLVFIDLDNPIGAQNNFFTSLFAHSARAYYPTLLRSYNTRESRFPELFFLDGEGQTKALVNTYIDEYVSYWTNYIWLGLYSQFHQNMPVNKGTFFKLSKFEGSLTDGILGEDKLELRKVCQNRNDEEVHLIPDDQLVYFQSDNKVYCISRIKLSNLAHTEVYEYKGIKIDPEIVDSFKSYDQYAVDELKKRTVIIDQLISYYYKKPQELDKLAYEYSLFGDIDHELDIPEKLFVYIHTELGVRINNDLAKIIGKQLNLMIQRHYQMLILDACKQYTRANRNRLREEYNTKKEVLQKVIPEEISNLQQDNVEKLTRNIMSELMVAVYDAIENSTKLTINENDKYPLMLVVEEILTMPDNAANIRVDYTANNNVVNGIIRKQELICDGCRHGITQPIGIKTVSHELGINIADAQEVTFCSLKCMNKGKFTELTAEDLQTTKIVGMVNKILEPYLSYDQMLVLAQFPAKINREYNPQQLRIYLQEMANKNKITFEEALQYASLANGEADQRLARDANEYLQDIELISEQINNKELAGIYLADLRPDLAVDIYHLGIMTIDENKNQLSYDQLWDRIKFHPLFAPNDNRMLRRESYEALVYLCDIFGVSLWSKDYQSAANYYSTHPGLLRQVWYNLRRQNDFERYLNFTVRTFPPNQTVTAEVKLQQNAQNINVTMIMKGNLDKPIERFFLDRLQQFKDREDILSSREDYIQFIKEQRKAAYNTIFNKDQFINFKDSQKFRDFDMNMKFVFEKLQRYISFDETFSNIEFTHRLEEIADYLYAKCQVDITAFKLRRFVTELISNNKAPDRMKYNINFFPAVINKFKCNTVQTIIDRIQTYYALQQRIEEILERVLIDIKVKSDEKQSENDIIPRKRNKPRILPKGIINDNMQTDNTVYPETIFKIPTGATRRTQLEERIKELRTYDKKVIKEDIKEEIKPSADTEYVDDISDIELDIANDVYDTENLDEINKLAKDINNLGEEEIRDEEEIFANETELDDIEEREIDYDETMDNYNDDNDE